MNYLLTEEMTEYRDKTARYAVRLPHRFRLQSLLRPEMERPCAMFVPQDVVVSYGEGGPDDMPALHILMKKT